MKTLSAGLRAHLDSGATQLCWCSRITRRSGAQLGFTDHDLNLSFDGTQFEAATGFEASEIKSTVGLSVDDLEVESALISDRLSASALSAGEFDDATIEIFRVNWSNISERVLMRYGSLGEVRRNGQSFAAEVRGLAHYLQQPKGRLYQYACDAIVGDARCGVDLSASTYRGTGTIAAVLSPRLLTVSGLADFTSGWFTQGLVTLTSGVGAGRGSEVRLHSVGASAVEIETWQPIARDVLAGATLVVTAGCDKLPVTCREKFSNILRYRGFPHMPGNDALASPPLESEE